jgi:hypothetical protein
MGRGLGVVPGMLQPIPLTAIWVPTPHGVRVCAAISSFWFMAEPALLPAAPVVPQQEHQQNAHAGSTTPLAYPWALWEVRSVPGAEYAEAVHPVGGFHTLEGFWAYWSRLPRLGALFNDGVMSACRRGVLRAWRPVATSGDGGGATSVPRPPESVILDGFGVFREGVRPEWEDPANRDGGEWGCRKGE